MSKPKIKKLGYPLWFNLVFYILTLLVPVVLLFVEVLKAAEIPAAFKVTFVALTLIMLVWFLVKKLILNRIETKLVAKQVALEHDYSIDVGDPIKIKYLWMANQRKLAIWDFITVIVYGGLPIVLVMGIVSLLESITGILMIIVGLYLIAYTLKFVVLTLRGDVEDE